MKRHNLSFLLVLILLGATVGCSSQSIRPGIWEMRFSAQDVASKIPVEVEPYDVRVQVDWGNDGNEIVEIERIDSKAGRLYGDIVPVGSSGAKIVKLESGQRTDPLWVFRLQGDIMSDDRIQGTAFMARHREDRETVLDGRWELIFKHSD